MSAPDSSIGSGLVFQKDDAWYLKGVHSVSLFLDDADEESHAERLYNSLYTKMSLYTGWIQEVTSLLQRNESVPPCNVTNKDIEEALSSWNAYYQHVLNGDPL